MLMHCKTCQFLNIFDLIVTSSAFRKPEKKPFDMSCFTCLRKFLLLQFDSI